MTHSPPSKSKNSVVAQFLIALAIGEFAFSEQPLPQFVTKDTLVSRVLKVEYGDEFDAYVGWDASEPYVKLPIKIYGFRGTKEASAKIIFFAKLNNHPEILYVTRNIELLSEICSEIRPDTLDNEKKSSLINLLNFFRYGPDSTLLDEISKKMFVSRGVTKEKLDAIDSAIKDTRIEIFKNGVNLIFFRIDEIGNVWKVAFEFNSKWEIEKVVEQIYGVRKSLSGYIR